MLCTTAAVVQFKYTRHDADIIHECLDGVGAESDVPASYMSVRSKKFSSAVGCGHAVFIAHERWVPCRLFSPLLLSC